MKKQMKRALTLAAALGMSFGLTISAQAAWRQSGRNWYYDMGSGRYATGWHYIDSTWYYFNDSGLMQTGWHEIGGKWYYLRSSGAMAHDQWVGNYYLGSSGAMLTNTWIGPYYVGADGEWIPNYNEKYGYLEYEIDEPVLLTELDVFYTNYLSGMKKNMATMKDKLGNTYENCIKYNYGEEDSCDIYVLDGEYSEFCGTIFVPKERNSQYDNYHDSPEYTFYVYGDDELLYYSPVMYSTQYPVDFDIDISGVDQLAISWYGGSYACFAELGLSNAMLYKD